MLSTMYFCTKKQKIWRSYLDWFVCRQEGCC